MQPKVMIVEEAGQVLETHILASLVQSVEQIVMIGDPLQLRPNINNYSSWLPSPYFLWAYHLIYLFIRALYRQSHDWHHISIRSESHGKALQVGLPDVAARCPTPYASKYLFSHPVCIPILEFARSILIITRLPSETPCIPS
jgi:hypothetical protein